MAILQPAMGRRVSRNRGKVSPRQLLPVPHLATPAPTKSSQHWNVREILDQRDTSECVAHAFRGFQRAAPVVNLVPIDPASLTEFYHDIQRNDPWEGESPEYEGTSVEAGAYVLQRDGYIESCKWAFTVDPVIHHLLYVGPVIFGTNWYSGFFQPDEQDYIYIADGDWIEGGHAFLGSGINMNLVHKRTGERGAIRIANSWGRKWGQNGRCWMSLRTLARLILEQGEACVPKEIKKAA